MLLTGDRTLTLKEVTERVSKLLNRPLELRVVSEDEYVNKNAGKPGPRGDEEFLRSWASTYKALEHGEAGVVDPLTRQILGRDLNSFEKTLQEILGVSDAQTMDLYVK